ncbi:MAG: GspH/FimT family pseudopilin, partial [Burkholderiaceae bacterium]
MKMHFKVFVRAGLKGFSLIELMVVLSIAAILMGIAVPSFRTLIQNQRMTTNVNDFFAAINLTRSEALQRGVRVDMVAAGDGSNWSNGWIVFVDENSDQTLNSNEKLIFTHEAVPNGISVTSTVPGTRLAIGFNATGSIKLDGNQKGCTVSFALDAEDKKRIKLNFLGRPKVCDPID